MTRPRVLLFLLILFGALLAPAAPASAHATPVGSDPAPGSVISTSPSVVTVTFSEPVAPVAGRIQVIAPDGERINGTPTIDGAVLTIPVRKPDRPLGTYLISFRVISADSHPIGGAITFSVGAPSARPEAATSTGPHWSVAAAVPTLRFTGYAGVTLIAGPALFLALLWPPRRSRRGALRLVRAGVALTAVATVGALLLQAPQGSGSAAWQVSIPEIAEVLNSQFGWILMARLAVLALIALLVPPLLRPAAATTAPARPVTLVSTDPPADGAVLTLTAPPATTLAARRPDRSRARAVLVLALGAAGLTTWPLTGHAVAAPMPWLTVTVGAVHMAAMAVWIGGLVTLIGFLLRGVHRRVLGRILPVWSRWAAMSVLWLAIAGGIQSAVQLGSVAALWNTGYGRLLLAKLGLLAVVLGFAALARKLVLTARHGTGLARTVGVEVVATVVILALSAVLVQVDPGRTAGVKDGAITGKGAAETLDSSIYALQFDLYPVELGEYNTVHAFLYAPSGAPLRAAEWELTARLLDENLDLEAVEQEIAPLDSPAHQALGSITFPLPGTYELAFTIRVDDLNRATVKTTVTVPPGK
ncbi:transport integral membrane protein [Actinoplanes sp. NBRC 101535]|nr:transport integral membrane protein [Actinoplanes sp. NBRC 101535]